MEKIVLKSQKREAWEEVKSLRANKWVPAIVYGQKQEALSIKLGSSDVLKAYRVAWENRIVSLDVDGKTIDVLFHEIQKAPVSGDIIHVDFYAITKWEKVHTHIPLTFVWVSKAKIEESAIIEEVLKQVEVKCLPTDLVDNFEVDLAKLEKIGDNIKVSDINISDKYEILTSQDEVVAIAVKPKDEVIDTTAPQADLPADPKAEK